MKLSHRILTSITLTCAMSSALSQPVAPIIEKVTLNSGLRGIVRTEPASRTLAICVFVGAGVAEDGNQPGIGALVSRALFGSNLNQTREEVLHAIYDVGGSLETEWHPDYTLFTCVTSPELFEEAMYVIGQALKGAQFDPESVSVAREEVLADITRSEQDSYSSAYAALRQRMYRVSPYREVFGGTMASVKRIAPDQARAFYRRYYTPGNTVISIAGNVNATRARRALQNYLEDYNRPDPPRQRSGGPELLSESGAISRFQPTSTATLLAGFAGPGISHPDYSTWQILSAIIGGGKSSRIWRAIRDSAGLGYIVRANAVPLLRDSPLVVYVEYDPSRPAAGVASIDPKDAGDLLVKTAKSVLESLPTERELDRAKTYVSGAYALAHQRARDRAFYLGWYELLGLGYEYDSLFPSRIAAVSLDQVSRAATTYLQREIRLTLLPAKR